MTVQSRLFSSASKSWESLCAEACEFATEVGRDRLIQHLGRGLGRDRRLRYRRHRHHRGVVLGVTAGSMTNGQVLWGLSNGVLVFAIAGAFWFGMALGPTAFAIGVVPWLAVLAVMVGGTATLVRAALRLRRRSGFRTSDLRRTDPDTRRIITGFRIVGLLEGTLVAAAVLLCRHFERLDLVWPAVGVAVSLHFLPLARLLNVPCVLRHRRRRGARLARRTGRAIRIIANPLARSRDVGRHVDLGHLRGVPS